MSRQPIPLHAEERIPPHSSDAEMAVLGALMLERQAMDVVRAILPTPDAFYREAHGTIYRAMLNLAEARKPIDIITLKDELRRIGKLGDVGGSHYLSELNMRTPTAAYVEHHARIIFEAYLKRRVIEEAVELIRAGYAPGTDALELPDLAARAMIEIQEERVGRSGGTRLIRDVAIETRDYLAETIVARKEKRVLGIGTGLYGLDDRHGGFSGGTVVVIAARPSMGKSALMMAIARYNAGKGKRGVIASLEMPARDLVIRMVAEDTSIPMNDLRSGNVTDEQWDLIVGTLQELARLNIRFDESSASSVAELAARWRLLKRKGELDYGIIDYLQLMHEPNAESRERAIATISRSLKLLAKELDIPIFELSQMNRALESRGDKRPQLSDLRESGAIEQDADVVLALHRPEVYGIQVTEKGQTTLGRAMIITLKARNGAVGEDWVGFDGARFRFYNESIRDDAPPPPAVPRDSHYESRETTPEFSIPVEGDPFI